jgi:hypothetical protein
VLRFLSAAAQNQNQNSDYSQHTASNLDHRSSGHDNSSFFHQNTGCAPRFEQFRATPDAKLAKFAACNPADRPTNRTSRRHRNNSLRYLTRVRRRCTKTTNTSTASTAHAI